MKIQKWQILVTLNFKNKWGYNKLVRGRGVKISVGGVYYPPPNQGRT